MEETMYKKNEKLKLLVDYEKDDPDKFIAKGTEVYFLRAVDIGFKSLLVVKHEDRFINIPEIAVSPTETDPIQELKDFNKVLIGSNPNLGIYHHNIIIRGFNKLKVLLFNIFILPIKKFLTKNSNPDKMEHDLSDLKKILNDNNDEDIWKL
jgi:hypothetical protein